MIQGTVGQNATLPCNAGDESIRAVEWTRSGMKEYVLFYRNGRSDTTEQMSSFKDRVQLMDSELKDGDVSVTLKNLEKTDEGTYECRVALGGSGRHKRAIIGAEPLKVVELKVSGPGEFGNFSVVSVLCCSCSWFLDNKT